MMRIVVYQSRDLLRAYTLQAFGEIARIGGVGG